MTDLLMKENYVDDKCKVNDKQEYIVEYARQYNEEILNKGTWYVNKYANNLVVKCECGNHHVTSWNSYQLRTYCNVSNLCTKLKKIDISSKSKDISKKTFQYINNENIYTIENYPIFKTSPVNIPKRRVSFNENFISQSSYDTMLIQPNNSPDV